MSICAKGVSTGVHNIAFSLSPDRFRAFDLVFFLLFFLFWCNDGPHEKGDDKMGCRTGWGRVVTVKGTRVGQDGVASFAFYHGVFHDFNGVADGGCWHIVREMQRWKGSTFWCPLTDM